MHMKIAAQQHGSRHDTGRITTSRPRASRQAGFQLVEMLIVIAILGIVSFVAIPSYLSFLDKVDYVTAETDIGHNDYPNSLADIGKDNLRDPWGNAYGYLKIFGAHPSARGRMRKDRNLVPINSDYDLYSIGKDGQSRAPFAPTLQHRKRRAEQSALCSQGKP